MSPTFPEIIRYTAVFIIRLKQHHDIIRQRTFSCFIRMLLWGSARLSAIQYNTNAIAMPAIKQQGLWSDINTTASAACSALIFARSLRINTSIRSSFSYDTISYRTSDDFVGGQCRGLCGRSLPFNADIPNTHRRTSARFLRVDEPSVLQPSHSLITAGRV